MIKLWLAALVAVLLVTIAPSAYAAPHHHRHHPHAYTVCPRPVAGYAVCWTVPIHGHHRHHHKTFEDFAPFA